jgi:uncharacterized protein with GYD domain
VEGWTDRVATTLSKKGEAPMARYMVQAAYTAEAIATLVGNPQDRAQGLRALIERLGGRMETFDYCLGEYDVMVTFSAPDDTSAVAIALAVAAPGHLKGTKTTTLIAPDEFVAASRKAGAVNYQAPSRG